MSLGASIGYWRGDIKGLIDDIAALRPTLFIGVPRVFDRIYTSVMAKVSHKIARRRCLRGVPLTPDEHGSHDCPSCSMLNVRPSDVRRPSCPITSGPGAWQTSGQNFKDRMREFEEAVTLQTHSNPTQNPIANPHAYICSQVKADGGLKGFLFNWGYKRKLYYLEEGRSYKTVRLSPDERH